jgi:hypothetical protein
LKLASLGTTWQEATCLLVQWASFIIVCDKNHPKRGHSSFIIHRHTNTRTNTRTDTMFVIIYKIF